MAHKDESAARRLAGVTSRFCIAMQEEVGARSDPGFEPAAEVQGVQQHLQTAVVVSRREPYFAQGAESVQERAKLHSKLRNIQASAMDNIAEKNDAVRPVRLLQSHDPG
jgi:hypothetical protein